MMKKETVFLVAFGVAVAALIAGLILFLPHGNRVTPYGGALCYTFPETGECVTGMPTALCEAETEGSFYVTDARLQVIWRVDAEGAAIAAGTPQQAGGAYMDGAADNAFFCEPSGILKVEGGYLIADTGNHVLRLFDPVAGTVSTFAGTGSDACEDGELQQASFSAPCGMCLDAEGNLFIADAGSHAIRKIDRGGYVSTFLGGKPGFADGSFDLATLNRPTDIIYHDEVFYIADLGNAAIRKIESGELTTVSGNRTARLADGDLGVATFAAPTALIKKGDALYLCDFGAGAVRKIGENGVSTLLRASKAAVYPQTPRGIFCTESGQIFLADAAGGTLLAFAE